MLIKSLEISQSGEKVSLKIWMIKGQAEGKQPQTQAWCPTPSLVEREVGSKMTPTNLKGQGKQC